MPEGCDISEWQATEPPADFAIVRAHSGYRKDTRVDQHWSVYASRGTPRGAYVYLVPSRDLGWQVMQMMDICPDPEIGWWIDAEDGGLTKSQILTALDIAKGRAGGRAVGLYGGIPFLSARGLNPGSWPWWLSHYGVNDGVRHPIVNPSIPSGWPQPVIHQYTSKPYDKNFATSEAVMGLMIGGSDVTDEQMATLGQWMQEQAKNVVTLLSAKIDAIPAGTGGGVTAAQVTSIVRAELNKTHLTG